MPPTQPPADELDALAHEQLMDEIVPMPRLETTQQQPLPGSVPAGRARVKPKRAATARTLQEDGVWTVAEVEDRGSGLRVVSGSPKPGGGAIEIQEEPPEQLQDRLKQYSR